FLTADYADNTDFLNLILSAQSALSAVKFFSSFSGLDRLAGKLFALLSIPYPDIHEHRHYGSNPDLASG
ncbi:hypothetical protein ACFLQR_04275, partial [Verrucomicrobiota bacterium]